MLEHQMTPLRGRIILLVILAVLMVIGFVRCRDSEQALTELMWQGDHKALEKKLRSNPSLANQRFSLGDTPLHLAVSYSNPSNIIQLLVAYGADVNAKGGGFGLTPLHKAAWNGSFEAVKALVANGADVNAFNSDTHTPLSYAITARSIEIIDFLLTNGAKINHGYPVLLSAESQPEMMAHLLAKGANPDARDLNGHTPLHRAVISDHTNTAELLLRFNASLRVRDRSGESALATAMHQNRLGMVLMILEASLRKSTNSVHLAAASGDVTRLRQALQESLVGVSEKDDVGFTALHWAALNRHPSAVELLLSLNADPMIADDAGYRPIDWAAYRGYTPIVELLLNKGLPSGRPMNPAFLMAVQQSHTETARVLLRRGADVNAALSMGRTALHIASGRGDVQTVRLLLENGANVNGTDRNQQTPLRNSLFGNSKEVIDLLVTHGANVKVITFDGGNLFHDWALGSGEYQVADQLLALKLDVNAANGEGRTPLHIAAHQGTTNGVRWLVTHGANVNVKDLQGRTPLEILKGRRGMIRRKDVADILRQHGAKE